MALNCRETEERTAGTEGAPSWEMGAQISRRNVSAEPGLLPFQGPARSLYFQGDVLLANSGPKLWKKQGQAESLMSQSRGVLGSEDLGVQVLVAGRPRWLSRSLAHPLDTVPSAEP